MSLQLNLFEQGVLLGVLPLDQPIEIGRRDKSDPPQKPPFVTVSPEGIKRWVVVDLDARSFPRKVCLIEPLANARLRVSNIHSTNEELFLTDRSQLKPGNSAEIEVPAVLTLPEGYRLEIRSAGETKSLDSSRSIADPWQDAMSSILGSGPSQEKRPETDSGILATLTGFSTPSRGDSDASQVTKVLGWIEHAVSALQCPVTSPQYFHGIAQAVARIIDMDRAEVILWNGSEWEYSESRRYIRPTAKDDFGLASESLLRRVLETKQVAVYPDPKQESAATPGSLIDLHTAIACPILDVQTDDARQSQVLGVLYADRRHSFSSNRPATVLEPEQKLVAILSTAVASSIARIKREQLVTKYQQFFSHKVTEAISQNPDLLEGESAEVTVLFCDIRGFSKATEKIGPKAAMNWVGETLSELSSIVLDTDGVLVDYVGDEMFAMWGAPDKSPDHAFRAAYAAKRMMRSRAKLNDRFASILPSPFDFGIGLCTGEVWVGNTGSKQKFKYGPMGQTVNMGSRVQGLTKQWGVAALMDQATASFLPSDLRRRRLSKVSVVGMDKAIDLYELMSDEQADGELIQRYEEALAIFETGQRFREAVKAFGELIQKYPNDGPSMVMLVRSVNELVTPSTEFTPVWTAQSK
ncbi:MAG: adenylate/guanylate cyclase domain-containing protein [Planctomycetota bacterium]